MGEYRVNHFVQSLCRRPDTIARLNEDPERAFEEFGLTEEERGAFREGSLEAMGRVGVHPLLQMQWMLARNPQIAQAMSILDHEGLEED